jgi:hypothetical protein
MKKGLSIILEQEQGRPSPGPGRGGSSTANNTPDPTPTPSITPTSGITPTPSITPTLSITPTRKEESKEVEISQRMAEMFDVFSVFDREGTNYIKKLKDEDREIVKSRVLIRLKRELGDDLSNMDDYSVLDDTFMNYLITYMVVDKKMDPFYIQYTPDAVYKLNYDLVEVRGLGKVLLEQGFNADTEKVYIQYTDGDNFKLVGGPGGKNAATVTYNRRTGQPVSGPEEPVKPSGEQPSQNKSSEPEKRPEEELGVSNIKMIQKKASVEGWAGVKDILKDSKYSGVKRTIEDKMREDYVLTFPGDETLDSYEMVDIVKDNPTVFKELGFTSMPMYRMKKKSGDEISQNLSTIIESGRVTKDFCKTAVKTFYELATDDYPIDVENLKSTALYLDRCRDQHGGKWGIGDVEFVDNKLRKSGTQYRLDRMSSLSPEFRINFSDNTVSGQKFK